MKIPRLPELDLAITTVLSEDEQINRLKRLKRSYPPFSYNSFRQNLGDMLNLQPEFDGLVFPVTAWDKLKEFIIKKSRNEEEKKSNIEIAKILYDYGLVKNIISHKKDIHSWPIGYGQYVNYWNNFYSIIDSAATFIFVDPRRHSGLTEEAQKFIFSMMHQRIRQDDPDFSDSKLLILQFPQIGKSSRGLKIIDGSNLFYYNANELNQMIDATFKAWMHVLADQETEIRRASGGSTPMGF